MSKLYIRDGEYLQSATQAEIDAAASEQMQQDAEVGRVLRTLKNCSSITIFAKRHDEPTICINKSGGGYLVSKCVDGIHYSEFSTETIYDALTTLIETGLIKEEQ